MLWNEVMAFMGIYRWHVESLNNIYCVRHSAAIVADVLAQMIKQTSGHISKEKGNLSQGRGGYSASRRQKWNGWTFGCKGRNFFWNMDCLLLLLSWIVVIAVILAARRGVRSLKKPQIFVFAEAASAGVRLPDWCGGCAALPRRRPNVLRGNARGQRLRRRSVWAHIVWCLLVHFTAHLSNQRDCDEIRRLLHLS